MVQIEKILDFLESTFNFATSSDVSYNGLQFEGTKTVSRIVTGVDASTEFLKSAIEAKANLAIVHHGLFWKGGEWKRIGSIERQKLAILLQGNLNLFALHLPLDSHQEFGNNSLIAKAIGAVSSEPFGEFQSQKIGIIADFSKSLSITEVKNRIEKSIGKINHHLDFGQSKIKKIAIVSGGGWSFLTDPRLSKGDVDALLTGEVIHQAVSLCQDRQIHLFATGHYASEVFGVQALGKYLAKTFHLKHSFINLPTGL